MWVPGAEAVAAKVAALLPRRAREAALPAMGIARLAGDTDPAARRAYHERMFGPRGS